MLINDCLPVTLVDFFLIDIIICMPAGASERAGSRSLCVGACVHTLHTEVQFTLIFSPKERGQCRLLQGNAANSFPLLQKPANAPDEY